MTVPYVYSFGEQINGGPFEVGDGIVVLHKDFVGQRATITRLDRERNSAAAVNAEGVEINIHLFQMIKQPSPEVGNDG